MSQPYEDPIFGPVISTYTRADAIEDGQLIDLSKLAPAVCRQHFKHPIACSAGVWALIDKAIRNPKHSNDLNGVIHDILYMSKLGAATDPSTRLFKVIIKGAGQKSLFDMKIHCGPGDQAEPVMTITLPKED